MFCETVADFQKLQEAKEVLCNESKRKNYDLWTRSGVTVSFHDWQALKDSVKTVSTSNQEPHTLSVSNPDLVPCLTPLLNSLCQSMHWAVRAKKEPMLEEAKAEFAMNSQAEDIPVGQNASEEDSHEAVLSFGK